jgi:hypothetical protein
VSCPTEALFSQLESFCLPVFSGFSPLFAETATKFSEVSRVTNFGNKPGLWSQCTDRLLLHDPADWRWPEGNRVTSLGHRQVLSSVLAEEYCSAQTASRRGCRFVLESCSSIARRIDSESTVVAHFNKVLAYQRFRNGPCECPAISLWRSRSAATRCASDVRNWCACLICSTVVAASRHHFFYRRYMEPQKCADGVAMFFWKRQRLIYCIAVFTLHERRRLFLGRTEIAAPTLRTICGCAS